MENYITSFSYSDSPFLLNKVQRLSLTFTLEEKGETVIDFVSKVPGGDWGKEGQESAFVTLFVDGEYNQDFILFYGEEVFTYERLLGSLPPGDHELTFVFQNDQSSSLISYAEVHKVEIRHVKESDPDIVFYKNAPLIYGRDIDSPFESVNTDTPLSSFYYCDKHDDGSMILEYHTIFSHEDGGTEAKALMSRWGRTTDIEWTYRVRVNSSGEPLYDEDKEEVFQGAEHVTTDFRGDRVLGDHPVLQAATNNGNFSDEITSDYRYLLKPIKCLARDENRESVMDDIPWTYVIATKEIKRQISIEAPHEPKNEKLGDPLHYFYIQTCKYTLGDIGTHGKVDIQIKLVNVEHWYSSVFNNHELAYGGEDGPFSTTVKLPKNTEIGDIEEIRASFINDGQTDTVEVKGISKAFFLGVNMMPERPFITTERSVEVSRTVQRATLWKVSDNKNG
ncbi:hypothetical protein LGQ02_18760 [Bacillus shivajii]|uniref:hypothetical protein n=1 Tax=Bacillus shivajii TaxID=1983719 RepID=UPI001CFACB33|nr:hypothetical protein [Bacillus shivajii]UCZ52799.1 hypothetical protein LGQ02_18760 [Bacillus shivajii]